MPTRPGNQQDNGASWRESVETISQVLFASGVVTAILYYFGYVRERTLFSYFGVPLGTLEFTTSDFLVRSAQAIFAPLLSVFLLGILALAAHQAFIARSNNRSPRVWRLSWMLSGGVAFGLLVVGAAGAYFHSLLVGPLASALALGIGAVLLDYSAWMATVDPALPAPITDALQRTRVARRILLVGVALIAAFWWTLNVANSNGLESAQAIESSLDLRGEAVVYSDERLGVTGHGVCVEGLSPEVSGYAFRYTGLRVLLHTGDQWILLPRGWTRRNGDSVILLPDNAEGLRIEVRP
jgi:hypothetical protein